MSVSTHLSGVASSAVLTGTEKQSIDTSISTLRSRLVSYFGNAISSQLQFGSSTRGTILPRRYDARSDVDYLIVFSDTNLRPKTYIRKLKEFAEHYYSTSEIRQSSPTIVLSLNHISFDLVPAVSSFFSEYNIPGPASGYEDWISTSPNYFNRSLSDANSRSNYMLKPAIRLVKYWNARSGYVFDSFELEKNCASGFYWSCSSVRDYFFAIVENMSTNWFWPKWRIEKVEFAKRVVAKTKQYEYEGFHASAEAEIKKLIP